LFGVGSSSIIYYLYFCAWDFFSVLTTTLYLDSLPYTLCAWLESLIHNLPFKKNNEWMMLIVVLAMFWNERDSIVSCKDKIVLKNKLNVCMILHTGWFSVTNHH
jgi:hypothetical protein